MMKIYITEQQLRKLYISEQTPPLTADEKAEKTLSSFQYLDVEKHPLECVSYERMKVAGKTIYPQRKPKFSVYSEWLKGSWESETDPKIQLLVNFWKKNPDGVPMLLVCTFIVGQKGKRTQKMVMTGNFKCGEDNDPNSIKNPSREFSLLALKERKCNEEPDNCPPIGGCEWPNLENTLTPCFTSPASMSEKKFKNLTELGDYLTELYNGIDVTKLNPMP